MSIIFEDPNNKASYDELKEIVFDVAYRNLLAHFSQSKKVSVEKYTASLTHKEIAELKERAINESIDVAAKIRNLADRVSIGFAYTAVQRKLHERFDEAGSVHEWLKERIDSDVSQVSTSAAFLFEILSIMDDRQPGYSDTLFPDEISFRKLIANIPLLRKRRENVYLTKTAVEESLEKKKSDLALMKKKLETEEDPKKRERISSSMEAVQADIKIEARNGRKLITDADIVLQESIKATFEVANTKGISREESPMHIENKVNERLKELGVNKTGKPEVEKPIAWYYADGKESILVITSKKTIILRIIGIISKFVDQRLAEPEELIRLVKSKIKKL